MQNNSFTKVWKLLSDREKKQAYAILLLLFVSAATAVLMVSSVMPFLLFLSDSTVLEKYELANKIHTWFGNPNTNLTIIGLGLFTISIIVLSNFINALRIFVLTRYVHMRAHSISKRLFELQLRQPLEYTMKTSQAVFIRRAIADPNDVASNFMMPFGEMLSAIITATGLLVFLYIVNPIIMFSITLFFCFAFGALFFIMKDRVHTLGKKRVAAYTQRSHVLQEALRCFPDIKMSGSESYFIRDFSASSHQTNLTIGLNQFYARAPRFLIQAIFFGGIIVAATILAIHLQQSSTTFQEILPTLGAFAFGGQRLIPELQTIYNARSQMTFGRPSIEFVEETIAALKKTSPDNDEQIDYSNTIKLKDVAYTYPEENTPVLKGLSIAIPHGQSIGIVGQSGSGKTTLSNIIMGLLSPSQGEMQVDKTIITNDNRKEWRKAVSYVPQMVQLYHDTLRKNLLPSDETQDDDTLIAILKSVDLDTWYQGLPQGLDTIIHGPTAQLSGGQKQRLGIARALAKNAELYVFDEATSALDKTTEHLITTGLEKALKDKTTITIAHRFETLQNCDRIIEVTNGDVTFDGTYTQWTKHRNDTHKGKNI